MRKMHVLKCWFLWPQYWRLSNLKWPPEKGRVEIVDGDLCVLVAQQDGLFCHQPAPSCKLIASHQLERPAPSGFHHHQGLLLPSTFLQLSHPGLDWIYYRLWCLHCSKYEFWAARNWTCLSFSFLFSGHLKKNHSAENEGLDYSQPGYLCGLQPTDHYLRPGVHQWTHSTALSLFWWPEQPILAENEWWVSFFESLAMHWRSSFKYPKSVHKCDIR